MLFVAEMEVLTKVIAKVVEAQLLSNLARVSPRQLISVLCRGDVVFLFRLEVQDLQAIKEILNLFSEASVPRMNYRKTTSTLIREGPGDGERVTCKVPDEIFGT
jgi:hypothetical protein